MRLKAHAHTILLLLATLILTGCTTLITPTVQTEPVALRQGEYQLDPAHATLLFKVKHLGISNYVGRFNSFDASLDFNPDDAEQSLLEAQIDVSSIDVNNRSFANILRGKNWFDVENHPSAKFVSRNIIIDGENSGRAIGELTIKGITKPAELNITFNGGTRNSLNRRYTIGFDGTMSFNRTDFEMDRFVGLVGDKINLEFYGEFIKQ